MGFMNLSRMPNPPTSRVSTIQSLAGGLNIHDIPWALRDGQSPELKNVWWETGALRSRPAQVTLNNGAVIPVDESPGGPYESAVYGHLYHGWYVIHCRGKFIALAENLEHFHVLTGADAEAFPADYPAGAFFLHNDVLYYKAKGAYVAITVSESFDETAGLYNLQATDVEPYVPTILINADPAIKGAGDLYQPVNRLTSKRTVTFNCGPETTEVILPEYASNEEITAEYLSAAGLWTTLNFEVNRSIPKAQTSLKFEAIADFDGIGSNNVRVTYSVSGTDDQYNSVMDCDIATVYGGGSGLCVVLAGCPAQPNAYFWSANTDLSMHPGYFPVEHYNLAGDASDPITALAQQQNMLVIFQKNRVGRSVFGTTDIDGRTFISMDYTTINPNIGCDLPKSIQLIENNLVFANKRRGVLLIRDTSSAYENNIVGLSQNVEKPVDQAGLLYDLAAASANHVCSLDDGQRYWLCAHGHAWVWDYSLGGSFSDEGKWSWFYFDNIQDPACWFGYEEHHLAFLGADGYIRQFESGGEDTFYEDGIVWKTRGEDYEKIVALPVQNFGTYEVLKNVNKAIFVVQGTGNARIDIEYETDYDLRKDLTPIMTRGWSLVPRDLSFRSLKVFPFAITAIRKPGCRNVRHFMVRLKNSRRGEHMTFVSAQIYFTTQGVDR